jgi:hypothetical protein
MTITTAYTDGPSVIVRSAGAASQVVTVRSHARR